MKKFVLTVFVALVTLAAFFPETADARIFGRRRGGGGGGSSYHGVPAGHTNSTAQGVANIMAALGYVGHFGGNPGYEGCGSGGSAAAAYGNCCFANSGMNTWDYGIAQGANGMFYCCRRYGNPPARVVTAPAVAARPANQTVTPTVADQAPAAQPAATPASVGTSSLVAPPPPGEGN